MASGFGSHIDGFFSFLSDCEKRVFFSNNSSSLFWKQEEMRSIKVNMKTMIDMERELSFSRMEVLSLGSFIKVF